MFWAGAKTDLSISLNFSQAKMGVASDGPAGSEDGSAVVLAWANRSPKPTTCALFKLQKQRASCARWTRSRRTVCPFCGRPSATTPSPPTPPTTQVRLAPLVMIRLRLQGDRPRWSFGPSGGLLSYNSREAARTWCGHTGSLGACGRCDGRRAAADSAAGGDHHVCGEGGREFELALQDAFF